MANKTAPAESPASTISLAAHRAQPTSPEGDERLRELASLVAEGELHPEKRTALREAAHTRMDGLEEMAGPLYTQLAKSAVLSVLDQDGTGAREAGLKALTLTREAQPEDRPVLERGAFLAIASAEFRMGNFAAARYYTTCADRSARDGTVIGTFLEISAAEGIFGSEERQWAALLAKKEPHLLSRLLHAPHGPLGRFRHEEPLATFLSEEALAGAAAED